MTAADWVGVAALAGAPTLAFAGVFYRAGQLAAALKELRAQVEDNGRRIAAAEQAQNRAGD
jgi:hypothetical protein